MTPLPMSELDLKAIRERAEKATPGPWRVDEDDRPGMAWNRHIMSRVYPPETVCFMAHSDGKDPDQDEVTANFIAHARTDVPALLAEVERLREQNRALTNALRRAQTHIGNEAKLFVRQFPGQDADILVVRDLVNAALGSPTHDL